MGRSGLTVLPQLFAEYMAFSIYYIQDEIEGRTRDLLKATKKKESYPSFVQNEVGTRERERWRSTKHTGGTHRYPEN